MTLSIHRSDRADALVRGLGGLLASVPADPFTPDLVAVPSLGVERWIAQTLSTSLGTAAGAADGICANVLFPNPSRLVADAVAVASGVDPDQDPWREERLTWHLLDVVDRCATEPWCRTLGRHLGLVDGAGDGAGDGRVIGDAGSRPRRSWPACSPRTASSGPSLLREWAAGADTDGDGRPLDEDLAWQAELWRRLRASVGVDSPAERVDAACRRLRDEPSLVDLPERFSVFGPTRLTSDQVQVLAALGEHRDVHLWLSAPLARAVGPGGAERPGGDPSARRPGGRAAAAPVDRVVRARRAGDAGPAGGRGRGARGGRVPAGGGVVPTGRAGPCWARCRRTSGWTGSRAGTTCATATGRCRCTPATAGSARSRCSARCCSACSRTTPPWSRAT